MNKTTRKSEPADEGLLTELRDWGGPAEMSAFEAMMWRVEADPRLRSTVTAVLMLDHAPSFERLREGHLRVTQRVPRFRQRVVEPAFGAGTPVWVDDPDFELDFHLRRIVLPAPGSQRQLLDFVQIAAMTPFDKARSPWEATLVEGLEEGRAAYVLKLHHSTSDGLGIMQLLSRVLRRQAEAAEHPRATTAERSHRRPPTPLQVAARQLGNRLLALPGETASTLSGLGRDLRKILKTHT